MTTSAVADRDADWPDALERGDRATTLLLGGVWLVFLVWPAIQIATSEVSVGWKAVGFAAMAVFVVCYLVSLIVPRPVRSLPRWVNTLGYTVILVFLGGMMGPAAGPAIIQIAAYVLALWLFAHPIRVGLIASAAIAVLAAAVLFTQAEIETAAIISGYLCIGLLIMLAVRLAMERDETARLLQEDLRLTRQREAFARDVHDVLGHTLTVISVKAELAKRLVAIDPDRAAAELADVQQLARRSLAEVRTTIEDRRTPELSEQLADAISALHAAGIQAEVPDPAEIPPMPRMHRGVLAWCLREAVTNVIRHADANRCEITIEPSSLTVIDDGVGLAAHNGEEPASGGAGLEGMRGRVAELSGTLTVLPEDVTRPRPGTRVEVRL